MKLALKLILTVLVVLAAGYAATPLWLSYILAGQLPPGWQLEELKSGYPGLSGISFSSIRVTGELGSAGLTLAATDFDFEYRSLKSVIDKVSLDVFLLSGETHSTDPITLDDLSFPVEKLTGKLPRVSIHRMDVAVHFSDESQAGNGLITGPVILDLEALELTPDDANGFHLASQLGFEDSLRLAGKVEIDVHPDMINAAIRFPSGVDRPWLDVKFDQETREDKTTSRILAALDADAANRDWLDSVFARGTGGAVTQFGGQFRIDANFAGQDLQSIESLSLTSENLHLLSDRAMLKIDAELQAGREDDKIVLDLPAPARLEYQGGVGWIDDALKQMAPELQLDAHSQAVVSAEIAAGSKAVVATGIAPFARYSGDIIVDLKSEWDHLALKTTGLQIDMADINKPESTNAEGLFALDWVVDTPVAYSSAEYHLAAGKLNISTEVTSREGRLTSKGSGSFTQVSSTDPIVSAENMDLTWKDLDFATLTGKLTTRTRGFSTILDDQTWKGFDLDMSYTLKTKNDVSGKGKLMFAAGPEMPLEFTGNTGSMRWDVKLPPTTIKLAKLRSLLSVAGIMMPPDIKMTDGDLELQGAIRVADDITAKMRISGHELAASLHNSKVIGGGFNFEAGYDKTIWANGPITIGTLDLAGGIDLKNIKADLKLQDADRFELNKLYADVFDGQLELDQLHYSGSEIADTTLRFSHVNFEKLLTYADVDGLQGTGYLDISLPVGSDQTGIHVKNGTFGSTGAGRLSYTKEGFAASNIGLKALENFQFKSLSGTLDYQSDGAYLMAVRLEGNNPDLYAGHPVVFNLKINGSLPALFEAMFMTGSFEESVLKQIRAQQ